MRFITIALLLLLIQVSAGILNAVGFTSYAIQPDQESFDSIEDNIVGREYVENLATEDTSVSFGFGDFFKGIFIFIDTVFWAVVNVKGTLEHFLCVNSACSAGVSSIARYISYVVYFIWGVAIAQFISNRATKGMQ